MWARSASGAISFAGAADAPNTVTMSRRCMMSPSHGDHEAIYRCVAIQMQSSPARRGASKPARAKWRESHSPGGVSGDSPMPVLGFVALSWVHGTQTSRQGTNLNAPGDGHGRGPHPRARLCNLGPQRISGRHRSRRLARSGTAVIRGGRVGDCRRRSIIHGWGPGKLGKCPAPSRPRSSTVFVRSRRRVASSPP